VLIIGTLALFKAQHGRFRPAIGVGCVVRGKGFDVPLTSEQAGIAAVIAGVAAHRSMPVRAVAIAYAAALQESGLANLPYGDRDSVGIFQQRPSEGWGARKQLLDPVYASTKFFAALAAVRGYQHLHIYQAAQAVQRSADGGAYGQVSGQGSAMASGFAGQRPREVWCWYGNGMSGHSRLAAATGQLRHAFGGLHFGRIGDPGMHVRVPNSAVGWAVASWLVTHANSFKIRNVSYQGFRWSAAHGQKGWVKTHGRRSGVADRKAVAFG
jgi:hypothetical protein